MTAKDYPSLQLIMGDLERRESAMVVKTGSLETKAGLNLGFSSLLITQVANDSGSGTAVAALLAVGALLAAFVALWPTKIVEISPVQLRQRYLMKSEAETRLALFDSRAEILRQREQRFRFKVAWHRVSSTLTVVAVLTFLTSEVISR